MTGNEQDAEDLVQETFLRTFKQPHRFDNRAIFATWLHRIAVNCALDYLRARQTRRTIQPYSEDRDHAHWLDSLADSDPSPERLTESNEIARRIQPALSQLSPNERAALSLFRSMRPATNSERQSFKKRIVKTSASSFSIGRFAAA